MGLLRAAERCACTMLVVLLAACQDAPSGAEAGFDQRLAALVEEVRIDGHREDLVPVGAVAVRADGVVAFTQAQDGAVRFYSSSGEPLGSFGRRGEGPGEFQNPFRLGWSGDTLWVYDGIARRITFVSPALELVRTVSGIPGAARPAPEDVGRVPEFPFASLQALHPDGSLYVTASLAVNQVVPEPFTGRTTVGRMSLDGVLERVILVLPPEEGGFVTTPGGGASASLPFGNRPYFGVAPDLSRVAVAMASLEGPEAETLSLTSVVPDGDTLFSRRYRFDGEPIPQAVGDSTVQATIARLEGFSADLVAAARREARVPPLYPPITNLVVGNDGTIWIEQRDRPEGRPYFVVGEDGEPVGTVLLAEGSRVMVATRERIWVSEPDELGVQSLVRYQVRWE